MNIIGLLLLILFSMIHLSCSAQEKEIEPNVAGSFYPSDEKELKEMIEGFLEKAKDIKREGRPIALISPHAGYIYSGGVAGYGYSAIKGFDYKNIIIIGPSHKVAFKGASVYVKGVFKTPLGPVKVNEALASKIIDEPSNIKFIPEVFEKEHSIEVQLPFLQSVLKDFTIVPIVIGSMDAKTFDRLASNIFSIVDERTLIIASSDLSHYHEYDVARSMDSNVIDAIERLSIHDLENLYSSRKGELCGYLPVLVTIEVSRMLGANVGRLYKYENSGDVIGLKDKVVGYASMGLYKIPFTNDDKNTLLSIAKSAIREFVINKKRIDIDVKNPVLKSDGAVFVTIKKDGLLRGCIGHVRPVMPLYQSVISNAISACSSDPRFEPVKSEELNDISIEISILSPLKKVRDINEIEVGRHGLVIRKGFYSGLLLPQVATEYGWDREKFLKQVSLKAGLYEDAWKDSDIYIFTADIIK